MPYNMSYCKFENTAGALQECYESLCDGVDADELSSDHERRGYKRLISLCQKIAEEFGEEQE